jgi:hypothetical protein
VGELEYKSICKGLHMRVLIGVTCVALLCAVGVYIYGEYKKTDHYAEAVWQKWYEEQFFTGLIDTCLEVNRTGVSYDAETNTVFCSIFLRDMPRKP